MMKILMLVASIFLIAFVPHAQAPDKFYGKLIGLQPDVFHTYQRVLSVAPVKPEYRFVPALEQKATVATGKLIDGRDARQIEAMLVEPPGKMPYIAIDLNADRTINTGERFTFSQPAATQKYLVANVLLPIKNPRFPAMPIYVRYFNQFRHPDFAAADRLIDQNIWAHAIGEVNIGGKPVLFQYPFDPAQPAISTTEGLFGIDADGDRIIHNEQFSLETSYANETEVVLRYGDMYLSTSSIDLAKNEIVVRRRQKSEYLREELEVGKQMPDFSFVDFAGKQRSSKEFRGKYLLIEWWGVWCVDCVRDMPYTVQAYERFRSRGLEMLGMNWDDKVEDAVGFLVKNKATWPQATKASIKTLTEVTYRIQEYPSAILLDPEGKVMSLNQKALQGEQLLETLDRMLPRATTK